MTEKEERRLVGPVPVLEHEQYRLTPPDARQEIGHGRVEAMALRVRIGAERRGKLTGTPWQLG